MHDFKKWLLGKQKIPVDLFALQGLVSVDKNFPTCADWRDYKNYLCELGADYSYIEAFERAWELFYDEKWGDDYEQVRIYEQYTSRTKAS